MTKKRYRKYEFELIAKDVLLLLVIAYVVLFIGAIIEAYFIVSG